MQTVMLNEGSLPMAAVLLETFAIGREVCITTGPQANRFEVRGEIVEVKDSNLIIDPSFYEGLAKWMDKDGGKGISVPITDICQLASGGQVIEFKTGVGAPSR